MKKGISLIVLVITIIVMIIIAGAIIVSITSTNVIEKANEAQSAASLANAQAAFAAALAEVYAGRIDANGNYSDITAAQAATDAWTAVTTANESFGDKFELSGNVVVEK